MQYKASAKIPIDTRRKLLCDLVNRRRAEILSGGLTFGGHRYDTDQTSLQNLTATVASISAGIALPDPFYWRSADNALVPHTAESISLLAASVLQFVNTVYGVSWEKKDLILASVSPERIDLSSGWP